MEDMEFKPTPAATGGISMESPNKAVDQKEAIEVESQDLQ